MGRESLAGLALLATLACAAAPPAPDFALPIDANQPLAELRDEIVPNV